jgi:sortase A
LTIAGVLALGYCLEVFLGAESYQARVTRDFAKELHSKTTGASAASSSTAPVVVPELGAVVGRLDIARIGLSVMVVEAVAAGDLRRAAGHIPGTALPGEPGNVGIAGHRDTCFRPLRSIQLSDTITVSTLDGAYRYREVSTKVVRPNDIQVLYPTGRDNLTLVTCFPFDYVGPAPKKAYRAGRTPARSMNWGAEKRDPPLALSSCDYETCSHMQRSSVFASAFGRPSPIGLQPALDLGSRFDQSLPPVGY